MCLNLFISKYNSSLVLSSRINIDGGKTGVVPVKVYVVITNSTNYDRTPNIYTILNTKKIGKFPFLFLVRVNTSIRSPFIIVSFKNTYKNLSFQFVVLKVFSYGILTIRWIKCLTKIISTLCIKQYDTAQTHELSSQSHFLLVTMKISCTILIRNYYSDHSFCEGL